MVYVNKLNTTFFTNTDEEEIIGIMWDAIHELKSLVTSNIIQFICDILECNAEQHNGNYYEWIR